MTQKVDVAALAALARLDVSEAELAKLEKEIPAMLAFVETIQKVSADAPDREPALKNVMRNDDNSHEGGVYTNALLDAAPAKKDNHFVVRQVISRKK